MRTTPGNEDDTDNEDYTGQQGLRRTTRTTQDDKDNTGQQGQRRTTRTTQDNKDDEDDKGR
jgi:hypothetical protein